MTTAIVTYDDANASLGIDVSDYQGDIDWAAVKASGIDFAMIRAGYRGATRGKLNETAVADNYTGAKDAGVKVGIYLLLRRQLLLPKRRRKRAMCSSFCRISPSITPSSLTGQQTSVDGSRTADATGEQITSYASAFCKKIAKAGIHRRCVLQPQPRL